MVALLIFVASITSGIIASIAFFFIAIQLFLNHLTPNLGFGTIVLIGGITLAVLPLSYMVGALLDSHASDGGRYPLNQFRRTLPVLSATILFGSGAVLDYFEVAVKGILGSPTLSLMPKIISLISQVGFCVSAASLALMAFVACGELPARWFLGSVHVHQAVPFAAIRLLLLVFILSLSANLILGLVSHELTPSFIRGVLG